MLKQGDINSAWKSGHKTGKRPLTGPDFNRNGPNRGHGLSIFENERPEKDRSLRTGVDRLRPV